MTIPTDPLYDSPWYLPLLATDADTASSSVDDASDAFHAEGDALFEAGAENAPSSDSAKEVSEIDARAEAGTGSDGPRVEVESSTEASSESAATPTSQSAPASPVVESGAAPVTLVVSQTQSFNLEEDGFARLEAVPATVGDAMPAIPLVGEVIGSVPSADGSDTLELSDVPVADSPDAQQGGSGLTFTLNQIGGSIDPNALAGFQAAADLWSTLVTDDINIVLDVGFSELSPGVLGQASSTNALYTYSNVRNALDADATSAEDLSAFNSLTDGTSFDFLSQEEDGTFGLDNDGSADNSALALTQANAKALGFTTDDTGRTLSGADADITFSSSFNWDFDQSDGVGAGLQDFVGVAFHEIGHALGFTSGIDSVDFNATLPAGSQDDLDGFVVFSALDLFRYSDASAANGGVQDLGYGSASYFSIDGGLTNLGLFSTGAFNGDGEQASHWKDNLGLGILDPTALPAGNVNTHTALDLLAFDVIGWDLASNAAVLPVEVFDGSNVSQGTFDTIAEAEIAALAGGSIVVDGGTYASNPEAVAVTTDNLTFTLPAGVTPVLTLSGPALDVALLSDGNAEVIGNGGNNTITGNDGDNSLSGVGGDDILLGGEGDDTIEGGAGIDLLDGGGNTTVGDTLSYASDTTGVRVFLDTGSARFGDAEGDTVSNFENIIGGSERDIFRGTSEGNVIDAGNGNNTVNGLGGDDTITGGNGTDRLLGSSGNDTLNAGGGTNNALIGGAGLDTLNGAENRDILRGEAGADVLIGNAGNDVLFGGFGADQFVFNAGDGADVINGFEDNLANERIDLSSLGITFADLTITDIGVSGDALVNYGSGTIRIDSIAASDLGSDDFLFV